MDEITFNEEKHEYTFKNLIVPSVTEIIQFINKDTLDTIPDSILNRASDRGTAVHLAIELFLKYKLSDIEDKYKNYFDAFLDWHKKYENIIKNIESEKIVFHKVLLYAGEIYLWQIREWVELMQKFKNH